VPDFGRKFLKLKYNDITKNRQVEGLYQNPQSIMLNEYFNTAGYSCAI